MKISEKIKNLLKERNWTLKRLHEEIKDRFEDNSIAYQTLIRTVNGRTSIRESSLFQIASAMGIMPRDIKKGTEFEEQYIYIRYNKRAYWEIEKNDIGFAQGRLVLLPGAKTESLKDPAEIAQFIKWLYGLQGETTCVVMAEDGKEDFIIKKHQSCFFKSTNFHYFENKTSQKSICLVIQNPKHLF